MKLVYLICFLSLLIKCSNSSEPCSEERSKRMVNGIPIFDKFVASLQEPTDDVQLKAKYAEATKNLDYINVSPLWVHFCGSTIISDQYVITTATCVYGREPANIGVRPSSTTWLSTVPPHMVNQINMHPGFKRGACTFDIAIVQVTEAWVLGGDIEALPVPYPMGDYQSADIGAIYGWPKYDQLEKSFMIINSRSTCEMLVPGIISTQICGSSVQTAICNTDHGGPLVGSLVKNNHIYMAGIIMNCGETAITGCAALNTTALFTRVTNLQIWYFAYTTIGPILNAKS